MLSERVFFSFLCFQSLAEINVHLAEAQNSGGMYHIVFLLKHDHLKVTTWLTVLAYVIV